MRRARYYTLIGHEPLAWDDALEWAQAFEMMTDSQRVVAQDHVGDVLVSTVFLGLDHSFGDGWPPLLFETMVFDESGYQHRYSTWEQAETGHAAILAEVRGVRRAVGVRQLGTDFLRRLRQQT